MRHYFKKKNHKKGLLEWLKVEALSLTPSTTKKRVGGNTSQVEHPKLKNMKSQIQGFSNTGTTSQVENSIADPRWWSTLST
jgi:hypothetical protein